jgi:glyoxylase-like metal-dependent hydrolase (beta-lactamase superfamily II)
MSWTSAAPRLTARSASGDGRPGTRVNLAINGYLILGGETPIVIDAGCRVGCIEKGIHAFQRTSEQTLAAALARFDLDVSEIGILALTHLHSDHTGELDALPNARIFVQREDCSTPPRPITPPRCSTARTSPSWLTCCLIA